MYLIFIHFQCMAFVFTYLRQNLIECFKYRFQHLILFLLRAFTPFCLFLVQEIFLYFEDIKLFFFYFLLKINNFSFDIESTQIDFCVGVKLRHCFIWFQENNDLIQLASFVHASVRELHCHLSAFGASRTCGSLALLHSCAYFPELHTYWPGRVQ